MRILFLVLLAAARPLLAQESYEVGPGDVLHVVVLGQAEMSGDFAVDREGMMGFPFLGKVKVSGMSVREIERKLTTLLTEGYLKRPQVSITIKESESRKVYVTGEVRRPGPYGLKPDRSLRLLLADIGELTADAGHEVIVVRLPKTPADLPSPEATPSPNEASPGEPSPSPTPEPLPPEPPKREGIALPGEVPGSSVFHVNLRELQSGNPDKDFQLEAGDTIYFPKAAQVYVTGHAARAGAFRYEEGLTVYKVLAMAGGVTERGSPRVRIIRIVDGKRKEFKAKPADLVQPEDTIVVPERFF